MENKEKNTCDEDLKIFDKTIAILIAIVVLLFIAYLIYDKVDTKLYEKDKQISELQQELADYKADETELMPCPFCGSTDVLIYEGNYRSHVECEECYTEGPSCSSRYDAAIKWNEREGD